MYNEYNSNDISKVKIILNSYGIQINNSGIILTNKIKRVNKLFNFNNSIDCKNIIDINYMSGKLKDKNIEIFLKIVDKIIFNITSKKYKYFTDIYILDHKDFNKIKFILNPNEQMKFDGIRLIKQNIILMHDNINILSAFILVFHEIAHSFYEVIDLFNDEYNAMKFEIKAIDKLLESISTKETKYSTTHDNYLPKNTIHFKAMEKVLSDIN